MNQLTKIVHYKPVKTRLNVAGLAKIVIDVVIKYYGLSGSIISDQGSLFILKFWLLLYNFFGIKQKRLLYFIYRQTARS